MLFVLRCLTRNRSSQNCERLCSVKNSAYYLQRIVDIFSGRLQKSFLAE
jgi:hypothetical protein